MSSEDLRIKEHDRDKKRPDVLLWLIPFLLNGLGILIITSTTTPKIFGESGSPFWVGVKQFRWMGLGLMAFLVGWRVRPQTWLRSSGPLWVLSLMGVLATKLPGVGVTVGGARRWIRLGGLSFQPGEVLYLFLTIHMVKMLFKNDRDVVKSFLVTMALVVVSAVPLLAQPDLGTTILIYVTAMGLFVERHGWRLPLISGLFGGVLLVILILVEPYRMRRIFAFVDPFRDPLDTGFQAIQGLIAFHNGGLWGTGLGHGFQKLQYLPAAYTDFVFAALGEEMGLVGTLGVLGAFWLWSTRIKRNYFMLEDDLLASLLWGIGLTIVLPLLVNVAGVTKLMPLTGMPLPFMSYGGTSLVMMWFRLGVILGTVTWGSQAKRGLT
ncbi:cell cycle protein [Thermanaerovibrio acidaminovorans DSM 6589]|uniref:Probable peptidoglycan glycosyltransferase FtsW n=1 Tax=Thermanaerovibrio acidaminovorans (strain ATCC 49978 / DSM 6589 / Su883) TaxID=525903 RepID=D1BA01_THEAS|nr:putative peptidoglycan glycosyltransferase FtsW [Thermanaerovibrio acidaminovorans]ACZ19104.1 cell cycle protein [Thermanaerovibrio acidaminovorans DSM 6589]